MHMYVYSLYVSAMQSFVLIDKGNPQFRRWEYWGFASYFCMHYTGDHSVFTPFCHRNAKPDLEHCKQFIRSAPFVKEKVCINIYFH